MTLYKGVCNVYIILVLVTVYQVNKISVLFVIRLTICELEIEIICNDELCVCDTVCMCVCVCVCK